MIPTSIPFKRSLPRREDRKIEGGSSTAGPRKKRCAKCGEKKETKEFPKHSTSSDGIASYCRDCKNKLAKERRLKDPIARLRHYIVTRIKNEWPKEEVPKDIHTDLEGYLGYRLFELKRALKQDVTERYGISLIKSFKEGYHLDHIKPHSSFQSERIGDDGFVACWAIENLRMIPALENLQKGKKLDFYTDKEKEELEELDAV